jgi:hypothetical protein
VVDEEHMTDLLFKFLGFIIKVKVKVKQSLYRPAVAQWVPGS